METCAYGKDLTDRLSCLLDLTVKETIFTIENLFKRNAEELVALAVLGMRNSVMPIFISHDSFFACQPKLS